jgi:hypothetical protein
MEVNVERTKVIRLQARQPPPLQIMIDQNNGRMWNISTIQVAKYQLLQDVCVQINPGLPW